jgi:Holliday junction DNA helicase RuvA
MVKGIGKTTAERLILELRDKMGKKVLETVGATGSPKTVSIEDDALQALMALGIARPIAANVVKKHILSNPELSLEEIIKQSLKSI